MMILSKFTRAKSSVRVLSPIVRFKGDRANAVPYFYQELFDVADDTVTPYRKLTSDYVSTVKTTINDGNESKTIEFLKVSRF